MNLMLTGKAVLVTAAGSGIGLAICERLLAEGAVVLGADRARPAEPPAGLEFTQVDLLEPGAGGHLTATALERFGRLDAVVTVLGGPAPSRRPFTARGDADWQRAFEFNLLSGIRLLRAAIPALQDREEASIVHIGSDLARQPDPAFVEYAAMKAALLSLSKSLSEELGPRVRSNVLSPGPTRTPGLDHDIERHIARREGISLEAALDRYVRDRRRMASGRLALPAEVARAAAYLVSPASAPMTGSELVIDGGARKAS